MSTRLKVPESISGIPDIVYETGNKRLMRFYRTLIEHLQWSNPEYLHEIYKAGWDLYMTHYAASPNADPLMWKTVTKRRRRQELMRCAKKLFSPMNPQERSIEQEWGEFELRKRSRARDQFKEKSYSKPSIKRGYDSPFLPSLMRT